MVFKIVRRVDGFKADAPVSMTQETQDPYSNQILTETDPRAATRPSKGWVSSRCAGVGQETETEKSAYGFVRAGRNGARHRPAVQ